MEIAVHLRAALRAATCAMLMVAAMAFGHAALADEVSDLIRKGNRYFGEGNYKLAQQFYAEAVAIDKVSPAALNNRGLALAEMDRLQEALADLTMAVRLRPEDGDIWNNRANVHCSLKMVAESVADRMQALRLGRFTAGQAQTGLRNSGFYRGPSDGIWGYDSDIALEDWTRAGCPKAPASRLL